ncbi:MAG: hypothetical protein KME07_05370 [Pegethrix bostrychoides GSE-TBD4-15B]|jgi:sensor histidine kinase YesM|uniref:Uncharacterized protein n=1 Tax=Pegethrix bostrychoides GSE-TBD4-15B TaxID=2839662 RepID=A0A951P880_9CYAN|nr:hypothetical protein [Pegethrix bostrychoides GSE-TBD4-15B]
MNVQDYYKKLNESCQAIFDSSISDLESFGKVHYFSTCLFEFADKLNEEEEGNLLRVVSSQIEMSALNVSFGLYRQAFSSTRLALEMGLGMVYFSAFKLEYREWLRGKTDIKWSKIIDRENGVLSIRFANAFFPELSRDTEKYGTAAANVYRQLSEFVHGNYETWEASGLVLSKNDDLLRKYFQYSDLVKEVLLFALCCRFLKSFSSEKLDSMPFILEELGHNDSIRALLGGLKE